MKRSALTSVLMVLLAGGVFALAVLAQDRTQLPVLVGVALSCGALLVALWHRRDLTLRDVLVFAVIFRLALVWLPPSLSDDAYRYVWDGLVQAEGANPYRYKPEDPALASLQETAVYARLNSQSYFSVYPPVSQFVFAFGSLFYHQDWRTSHYAIKIVLLLAELAAMLLLARMVTVRALMLYAWNPLVLLETAGQGHTESLLLLLMVVVIVADRAGRGRWAAAVLAAASWVKLFPVVLFPFLWRRYRWNAVWPGAAALVILAVPYAAPYVVSHVRESLSLYTRYFEFNAGLYYGIKELFYWLAGADYSKQIGPTLQWCLLMGLPVLYAVDYWRRWSLEKAFFCGIGLYLLFSTTVHPWYLLTLLFLGAFMKRPVWPLVWLGVLSIGTYLLYVGGPYWEFVIAGWGGGLVLAGFQYRGVVLQAILEARGWQKVRFILPFLPRVKKPLAVLDLGCGEGYVGEHIRQALQAEVALADIVDMNRTALPHTVCQPGVLPWATDSFDVVVLVFVLHHAQDPAAVLQEARRVARQRVVVVESVYRGPWGLWLLTALDKAANRLRHWTHMAAQEEHLGFRSAAGWRALFRAHRLPIIAEGSRGWLLHRQQLFVLE